MRNAPNITAVERLPGIPSFSNGMTAPLTLALFALSGAHRASVTLLIDSENKHQSTGSRFPVEHAFKRAAQGGRGEPLKIGRRGLHQSLGQQRHACRPSAASRRP